MAEGKLDSEFERTALDALTEAEATARLRTEELKKAQDRSANTVLTAPIAGTVQQLAVTTLGGVVKPADPLMVIVPQTGVCAAEAKGCSADQLIVEAMASNKDVGFLAVGQPVEVKLEAYPFTRYGVVPGTHALSGEVDTGSPPGKRVIKVDCIGPGRRPYDAIVAVSQDAIERESGELIFPIRVQLERDHIMVNAIKRGLAPGLAVTAEVKTGRRRIIDFLLSPLARRVEEAGRER